MSARIWKASENYYPALRKMVTEQGYYQPNVQRSIFEVVAGIAAFFACVAFSATIGHWFVTAVLAVVAGLVSLQLGYVMHDAGHRQCSKRITTSPRSRQDDCLNATKATTGGFGVAG